MQPDLRWAPILPSLRRAASLLLPLALFAASAQAATCTSTGALWGTAANWSCSPVTNAVPAVGDTAIINSNMTVNTATNALASLTVNNGFTLTQSSALTVSGPLAVAGTLTSSNSMTIGGTTTVSGPSPLTSALNITANTGSHTFTGKVTIAAGGTWNNSGNEIVTFQGGLSFSGAAFNAGTAVQTFNTSAQTIDGTLSIPSLTVTGVTLTNNGNLTVSTALAGTGTFANGTTPTTASLTVGMSAIGVTTLVANATGNTVVYNRANTQTVDIPVPASYYNLTLAGTSAKTLPASVTAITNNFTLSGTASATGTVGLAIGGNVTIGTGTTFASGAFIHTVQGDFINSGTFTPGTGSITFIGSTSKNLGGTTATTFNNLGIDKTAGNLAISCGTPSPTVTGNLGLTSGKIITSGPSPTCSTACSVQLPLIVSTAATISYQSSVGYVQGALRKSYAAAANLGYLGAGIPEFPIGDASNYTPVKFNAGTTTTAGTLTACVTATDHPQITTAGTTTAIDSLKSVNRYWSLTTSGITSGTLANATFVFNGAFVSASGDVDNVATSSNFIVEEWDGTAWSPTTLVFAGNGFAQASNISLTGANNEFAIGELLSGITGSPGNFNAFDTGTTAGAVLGKIQTKQSGVAFSVRLARLNATRTALDTTYTQAGVTVELLDASDNTGALSGTTACRPIGAAAGQWHVIAGTTQTVNFASGIVNATFSAAMLGNAYRDVRVHVVKTATGAGEGCSTDLFAIRPQSITVAALDSDWQSAGTTRTLANTAAAGGNVHKASTSGAVTPRPFTLRATPVPATATLYDGSPTAVAGFPSCGAPLSAALCNTAGSLSMTPASWTSAGSGVRQNADSHYSEAGTFNLQLEDAGYASVDSVDGTSAAALTIPVTATVQVGRFVPDHFAVATDNTPQYRTFNTNDASCSAGAAPRRTFSYVGQTFGWVTAPRALITAQNAGNGTTTNYRGTLWKLVAADVSETYPALPFNSSSKGTPSVISLNDGTGTSTSSSGGTFLYTRSVAQAAFTANISMTASVQDATESGANQGTITTASPALFDGGGTGIAFDGGGASNGAEFRYGQMRINNTYGSELLALPVIVETRYWNGTTYATNSADNCTSMASANFVLANAPGPIVTTTISGSGAMTAGIGKITLTKPTVFTAKGTVTVTPAASVSAYLPAVSGTGRETFGIYRGAPIIFFREMY
ncbi:MAG: DUF6701 domain-containing protein [Pseudomonadota bacterium]